jgi:hypothetical protein
VCLDLEKVHKQLPRRRTSCIISKRGAVMRDRFSLNFQFEHELKQQRRENQDLRLSLDMVLSKLGELHIIEECQLGVLEGDIESGAIVEKIAQQLKERKECQVYQNLQQPISLNKEEKREENENKKSEERVEETPPT